MKYSEHKKGFGTLFSILVIPILLTVSILIYTFVFGDPSHFQGGDSNNLPIPGDYFGIIYKGGFIVPVLMTCLMMALTYSGERFFAIYRAKGKGSVSLFLVNLKRHVADGDFEEARKVCREQQGVLGNVCLSVLDTYASVSKDDAMAKDQKIRLIQKNCDESIALELPALEQNLVVLATLSSISTLIGLLGTVLGMIRAFAALANAGAPDSVALSAGISEALINTALGIGSSAIAIIFYNIFTTQIDKIIHSIEEAGYALTQTFAERH